MTRTISIAPTRWHSLTKSMRRAKRKLHNVQEKTCGQLHIVQHEGMSQYNELKGKKSGDRVVIGEDHGTVESVVTGFAKRERTAIAYWIKWDRYAPTCISFDKQGNRIWWNS